MTKSNDLVLGRNVLILKDAQIGNNSIVGAGSIVTKIFDANSVILGFPTKLKKGTYE